MPTTDTLSYYLEFPTNRPSDNCAHPVTIINLEEKSGIPKTLYRQTQIMLFAPRLSKYQKMEDVTKIPKRNRRKKGSAILSSHKCAMCGRKFKQGLHGEQMEQNQQAAAQQQLLTSTSITVNGIEHRFDSEFCAVLFRKLQGIYGDGFCSDLV